MDENHRTVGGSPMANIKTMIAPRTTQRLHHHKMHIALCLVATILMAAVPDVPPRNDTHTVDHLHHRLLLPAGHRLRTGTDVRHLIRRGTATDVHPRDIAIGCRLHHSHAHTAGHRHARVFDTHPMVGLGSCHFDRHLAAGFRPPRSALAGGRASFFVLLALYIITYAMCASIRTIAIDDRQRHRDAELELLQTQQAHQREVTRFAQMTHDAVTASLSSIFLLAQQHIDMLDTAGKTADASDEDWRTVRQLSESALASIRSVIRTMNASDERPEDHLDGALHNLPLPQRIGIAIEQGQHLLAPHHMHVDVHTSGQISSPPAHGQATRR